jgi:hypothetical protein
VRFAWGEIWGVGDSKTQNTGTSQQLDIFQHISTMFKPFPLQAFEMLQKPHPKSHIKQSPSPDSEAAKKPPETESCSPGSKGQP